MEYRCYLWETQNLHCKEKGLCKRGDGCHGRIMRRSKKQGQGAAAEPVITTTLEELERANPEVENVLDRVVLHNVVCCDAGCRCKCPTSP